MDKERYQPKLQTSLSCLWVLLELSLNISVVVELENNTESMIHDATDICITYFAVAKLYQKTL